MTLYPNIIYHPDTGTTLFIDTLQEIDGSAQSELITYQSSIDGSLNTFERESLPRTISLTGKIGSDNENTLRRQLQYLRGKQVYLMLGARNLATLAKIRSFDMPVSVGTYTPLALDVVCEGSSEGQFWEAEDSVHIGTQEASSISSGGQLVYLNISGKYIRGGSVIQSGIDLPVGDYTLFARAYDSNQVSDDFELFVYNESELSTLVAGTSTLESTYGFVLLNFAITSSEENDEIRFYSRKYTGTANTIYVDCMGFVRID
jgi:hypothetical protein